MTADPSLATARPQAPGYDDFAAVLVHRLNLPVVAEHAAPRPGVGFWSAVATFGLWPAIVWPLRFNGFVAMQREQLIRFAEWMRWHENRPEAAAALVRAAEAIRVRTWLAVCPAALCLAIAAAFFTGHPHPPATSFVLRHTYRFHLVQSGPAAARFYAAWIVGLSAVYLCQLVALHLHAGDIGRFVERVNRLDRRREPELPAPQAVIGMYGGWVAAAVILAVPLHAPWGIVMALAGAAQRRYVTEADRALRAALARRIVQTVARHPVPSGTDGTSGRCGRERCGAPLPQGARFCPRCGSAVAGRLLASA